METKQKGNCVLCGYEYNDYGHSPQPLADKGRVCSKCEQKVIKARLQVINYKREEDKFKEPTFLRNEKRWRYRRNENGAIEEIREEEERERERVSRERIERIIIESQDGNDREENEINF